MRKKLFTFCILGMLVLVLIGCEFGESDSNLVSSEGDNISSMDSDDDNVDSAFSAEDINSIMLEGNEYTIPIAYEDILNLGWTISSETDETYEEAGTLIFIIMENENYPNVPIYLTDKFHGASADSVEELADELTENGIWGIAIDLYSIDGDPETAIYPDLKINGVGFGCSSEDVFSAFGNDYDQNLSDPEDEYYVYTAYSEEGEYTIAYRLMLGLTDDKVDSIDCYVYYF